MSYDITFLKVPDGGDPSAAYAAWAEQEERIAADLDSWKARAIPAETRAQMQLLADSLKKSWPDFQQFEPDVPLPWIELDDDYVSVQVGFVRAISRIRGSQCA